MDSLREFLGDHRDGRGFADGPAHRRARALIIGAAVALFLVLGLVLMTVFYR